MNLGILGFGTVGRGVYEILKDSKEFKILKILDKNNYDNIEIMTNNIDDIINDSNIDVVVEVIGGTDTAYDFIKKSLESKKSVVTANKAVVAKHLNEFLLLANKNNVKFMFEAAVGGGIPWIASLHKAKRVDVLSNFSGIFNGTSNFILDKMTSLNLEFSSVLKEAQDLGYAEADPSADIKGYDVKNKVIISSAVAFDLNIRDDFFVSGIENISKTDISYFKKHNKIVKLIGSCYADSLNYEACVIPTLFSFDNIEANVATNFNVATLVGKTIGELKFYGQGAGKLPTANAIIQDLLDLSDSYSLNLKNGNYVENNRYVFIIRTHEILDLEKSEFENNIYYKTDLIYLSELKVILSKLNDSYFVAREN